MINYVVTLDFGDNAALKPAFDVLPCGLDTQDDETIIDHYVAGCDPCENAHAPECTNNKETPAP